MSEVRAVELDVDAIFADKNELVKCIGDAITAYYKGLSPPVEGRTNIDPWATVEALLILAGTLIKSAPEDLRDNAMAAAVKKLSIYAGFNIKMLDEDGEPEDERVLQ